MYICGYMYDTYAPIFCGSIVVHAMRRVYHTPHMWACGGVFLRPVAPPYIPAVRLSIFSPGDAVARIIVHDT